MPPKTSNVHIGFQRYAHLSKVAIDVSYQTGKQMTPSQVCQHVLDTHLESCAKALINKEADSAKNVEGSRSD